MEVSIAAERRSVGKGGFFYRLFLCGRHPGQPEQRGCCRRRCGWGGGPDADDPEALEEAVPSGAGVVMRGGRFMPASLPGTAALPPERRSRWSIQARFLPPNVKEAGRLDNDVRNGIMTAALGHGPGGPVSVSAVGKRFFGNRSGNMDGAADLNAAAEEAARKDPALQLFDVLQVCVCVRVCVIWGVGGWRMSTIPL
jgi:hypothetical protein